MTSTGQEKQPSYVKASIIVDLWGQSVAMSQIIKKYSKPSSKGIYRHLRDLKSERIIRDKNIKGSRKILTLNYNSINAAAGALDHFIEVNRELENSLDSALVECAISAYGDFPIFDSNYDKLNSEVIRTVIGALAKAERPDIDDQLKTKVLEAMNKIRGKMTTADKLAYITVVDNRSREPWSPERNILISLCMPFTFRNAEIEEKKDGLLRDKDRYHSWKVMETIFSMFEGKRKHFMVKVKDDREVRLLGVRSASYLALRLPLTELERDSNSTLEAVTKRYSTPEKEAEYERRKITDINQVPEVYRKNTVS
jgi:hypothetical protein